MPLAITFDADFADVFEVRGTRRDRRGTPARRDGRRDARSALDGLDDVERRTRVALDRGEPRSPTRRGGSRFTLEPQEVVSLELTVRCEVDGADAPAVSVRQRSIAARERAPARAAAAASQLERAFNRWVNRSSADLQ